MQSPSTPTADAAEEASPPQRENPTGTRRLGLKSLLYTLLLSLIYANGIACLVACLNAAAHWLLRVASPAWLDPSGLFKSASLLNTLLTTRDGGFLVYIPYGLLTFFVPVAFAKEDAPCASEYNERIAEVRQWWTRATAPIPSGVSHALDFTLAVAAGPLGAWLLERKRLGGEVGLDPWHAVIVSLVACGVTAAALQATVWKQGRFTKGVNQENKAAEQMEKGLSKEGLSG